MNFFRTTVFDPSLIVGQILCMQSIFYSTQTFFMFAWSFTDFRPTMDMIFSLEVSRPMVVMHLLSVMVCASAMPLVIERAKQCLDFAFTIHFIHALMCALYVRAFPTHLTWWLLQSLGVFICTVVGEYLCMKREMMEIPLNTIPMKVINT